MCLHPPTFHFVLIPSPPMAKLMQTSELQCMWEHVLCSVRFANGEVALAEGRSGTVTS